MMQRNNMLYGSLCVDRGRCSTGDAFYVPIETLSIAAECSHFRDCDFQQTSDVAHSGGLINMSDCSLGHLYISAYKISSLSVARALCISFSLHLSQNKSISSSPHSASLRTLLFLLLGISAHTVSAYLSNFSSPTRFPLKSALPDANAAYINIPWHQYFQDQFSSIYNSQRAVLLR